MKLEVTSVLDEPGMNVLRNGLSDHASSVGIEPRNAQELFVIARRDGNQIVGGLAGATVWGWVHIEKLWVHERHRALGLGTSLMRAAENEARERGCHHALLDTFDFQARPFYERLGYRVFGEAIDFPTGHSRFFMSKRL